MDRTDHPDPKPEGLTHSPMWQRAEDDLLDITLVAARMMTTGPERYSLDDILAEFGYTREQLRDLPE